MHTWLVNTLYAFERDGIIVQVILFSSLNKAAIFNVILQNSDILTDVWYFRFG